MRKVWKRYEWFVVKEEQKQHNEIHVRDEKIECKALQILSIFKSWIIFYLFIYFIIWLLFVILTSETLADNQINKQKCITKKKKDSSPWNNQMCCSKDHQWWKPWPWDTLILLPLCWRVVLEVSSNHMKKVLLGGSSKESSDYTVREKGGHGWWD